MMRCRLLDELVRRAATPSYRRSASVADYSDFLATVSTERINAFLAMLDRGQDSALLRYSLGNEYLSMENFEEAAVQLRFAVDLDRNYSAAWKQLGRALVQLNRDGDAIAVYREGIDIAEKNGDRQAAKEMTVFLKRLLKKQSG
jgi:predicted Zn-dependent protease